MMRPIDADELKEHICNMCDDGERECKGDESCAMLCWVNDMPKIEPIYPQWISVNDRLPEDGLDVLVYTKALVDHIQVAHIQYGGTMWELSDGAFYFSQSDVSHWMLLPKDPEVKNDV